MLAVFRSDYGAGIAITPGDVVHILAGRSEYAVVVAICLLMLKFIFLQLEEIMALASRLTRPYFQLEKLHRTKLDSCDRNLVNTKKADTLGNQLCDQVHYRVVLLGISALTLHHSGIC
jgi:hypothetical protein